MRILMLTRSAVVGREDGEETNQWFNSKSMVNGLKREGGRKGGIYCRNVDSILMFC